VESVALEPEGTLTIETSAGALHDERPSSFQPIDGRETPLDSRFIVDAKTQTVGFQIARYDPQQPLVIDPGIVYSTYLSGSNLDVVSIRSC